MSYSKYKAKPTVIDGHRFPSRAEGNRYVELKLQEKAGAIKDLLLQQTFRLTVNGVQIGKYVADFTYTVTATGQYVVEDCKGVRTPLYQRSKKHVAAEYGIEIYESGSRRTRRRGRRKP